MNNNLEKYLSLVSLLIVTISHFLLSLPCWRKYFHFILTGDSVRVKTLGSWSQSHHLFLPWAATWWNEKCWLRGIMGTAPHSWVPFSSKYICICKEKHDSNSCYYEYCFWTLRAVEFFCILYIFILRDHQLLNNSSKTSNFSIQGLTL